MRKFRVYLDNCCFNRPYDSQASELIRLETEAKLYIQGAILSGRLTLVWSFILDYENAANPYPERREAIVEWKALASHDVRPLEDIRERANAISALTGIRPKDALHLACSIHADCDYFITTDRGLLKKAVRVPDAKAIGPLDFLILMEGME
ncbi:PIN domain protein [Candidatus Thiodictyon syntrophicum]|uniref:PIN domain protein n=2 Tax=Candidatus Thiodictyon syntrophicum TaxID=1166950 RepID=A0A2K8U7F7_9GAMM|nr:PIN domain protein [Candidatus Thiodictyon syntrophicum]